MPNLRPSDPAGSVEERTFSKALPRLSGDAGAGPRSEARKATLQLYSELANEVREVGETWDSLGITAFTVHKYLISKLMALCEEAKTPKEQMGYIKEIRALNAQVMVCEVAENRTRMMTQKQMDQQAPWITSLYMQGPAGALPGRSEDALRFADATLASIHAEDEVLVEAESGPAPNGPVSPA